MLKDALQRFLALDADTIRLMREECLSRAKEYSADFAFGQMVAAIEKRGGR